MRQRQPVIPSDERLYRTVEADWVDGSCVLPFAIDGEGSSCARSAFAKVEDVLKAAEAQRPAENGLVFTTPGQLPVGFVASNKVSYDVFAYDDPLPADATHAQDDSHCEIRWRRVTDRPATDHVKKVRGAAKDELKLAIAAQMTVLIAPQPIGESEAGGGTSAP